MQTIELEKEKRPKIFASKEEMSQELTPLLECRLESKKNCMVVKLGFPAAETAIDRVYAVYGMLTSVTKIINGIQRDKKDGTLSLSL